MLTDTDIRLIQRLPTGLRSGAPMRRDLTTGQRAMGHAVRFPETEKLKRRSPKTGNGKPEISSQRIAEAREIIADGHNNDLVADVPSGALKLGPAVAKAKKREIERSHPEEAPPSLDPTRRRSWSCAETASVVSRRPHT